MNEYVKCALVFNQYIGEKINQIIARVKHTLNNGITFHKSLP